MLADWTQLRVLHCVFVCVFVEKIWLKYPLRSWFCVCFFLKKVDHLSVTVSSIWFVYLIEWICVLRPATSFLFYDRFYTSLTFFTTCADVAESVLAFKSTVGSSRQFVSRIGRSQCFSQLNCVNRHKLKDPSVVSL